MKKLKVILLSMLVLSPSIVLAKAKMLKTPEGSWINEDVIYEIAPLKNGCKIYYTAGSGVRNYTVTDSCNEYIKRMDIETKE